MRQTHILTGLILLLGVSGWFAAENFDSLAKNFEDNSKEAEITLLNEPIAEQSNRVLVSNKNDLQGEEVIINGKTVGTLNDAGIARFEVPNAEEATIKVAGLEKTLEISSATKSENSIEDGLQFRKTPIAGEYNTLTLQISGNAVKNETVYLDNDKIGKTNQYGEIRLKLPSKDRITVSTESQQETFDLTEDKTEPEILLNKPSDYKVLKISKKQKANVTFEASVETIGTSGTAVLILDGVRTYTQQLSPGINSFKTTQELPPGAHAWSIDVSTPNYDVSSLQKNVIVNEAPVQNGLSLQNTPAHAGEYNYVRLYDTGEPIQGEEVTINGNKIGVTKSNGEIGFKVPSTQKIKISAQGFSEVTYNVGNPPSATQMDFSFSNNMYKGRSNTLTISNTKGAVSNATIYVNGIEKGRTDSSGQIKFTIPKEDNLIVNAVKGASNQNKTFSPQTPPLDISWVYPNKEASIDDYETILEFNLDLQEPATYELKSNGRAKISNSLESGSHSIEKRVKFETAGSKEIDLVVSSDSETIVHETSLHTQQDLPPIQTQINSPVEGSSVNQYWILSDFLVDSPEEFNYTTFVDGSRLFSDDLIEDRRIQKRITCLEPGDHNFLINTYGKEFERSFSNSVSFETTMEPPIADILINDPSKSELNEKDGSLQQLNPKTNIWACENVEYNVHLSETSEGSLIFEETGSLEAGEKLSIQKNDENLGLPAGNYSLKAMASTSGNTIEVERNFEYQN